MIRFVETIKFDQEFAKAIYDTFYDFEKEKLDFFGKRNYCIKKYKGWPDGLDAENFEVDAIYSNSIIFVSGRDWQEMIPVKLVLLNGKLYWTPYDSYTKMGQIDIKCACNDLVKCVQGQIKEDCQIAGPVMGEVPANINGILSLGYKDGQIPVQHKKNQIKY